MNRYLKHLLGEWVGGWMDRLMNGWMDGTTTLLLFITQMSSAPQSSDENALLLHWVL